MPNNVSVIEVEESRHVAFNDPHCGTVCLASCLLLLTVWTIRHLKSIRRPPTRPFDYRLGYLVDVSYRDIHKPYSRCSFCGSDIHRLLVTILRPLLPADTIKLITDMVDIQLANYAYCRFDEVYEHNKNPRWMIDIKAEWYTPICVACSYQAYCQHVEGIGAYYEECQRELCRFHRYICTQCGMALCKQHIPNHQCGVTMVVAEKVASWRLKYQPRLGDTGERGEEE